MKPIETLKSRFRKLQPLPLGATNFQLWTQPEKVTRPKSHLYSLPLAIRPFWDCKHLMNLPFFFNPLSVDSTLMGYKPWRGFHDSIYLIFSQTQIIRTSPFFWRWGWQRLSTPQKMDWKEWSERIWKVKLQMQCEGCSNKRKSNTPWDFSKVNHLLLLTFRKKGQINTNISDIVAYN